MKARPDISPKVGQTIRQYQMLHPGEKVVVAASGGIDSTVLLHLLHRFSERQGYSLHVAHLNHMLRGEESQRDADFVRDYACQLGVETTIRSVSVKGVRRGKSDSLQETARQIRYAFLKEVAEEVGASKIALGHTRDDQAETVLLNLLRGAGRPGLRGIPPVREGRFIRPLIETTREEIEGYAQVNQIPFVSDSSNLKVAYLRNRIRLHLLPLLRQEYNPQLSETLAAIASILGEEEDLLESLTSARLSSILLEQEEGQVALSIPGLLQEPIALQRRILIAAVRMAAPSYLHLSHRHIFSLQELLLAQSGSQLTLPGGMEAFKDYDRLLLESRKRLSFRAWAYPLPTPGIIQLQETGLRIRAEVRGRQEVHLEESTPYRAFFDADRARPPLLVRNRRPGDYFYPLGMGGGKKLKEFLIDAKVSRGEREETPLLVSGAEIAWVIGFRIDERYRVREETQKVLAAEVIRDEDG